MLHLLRSSFREDESALREVREGLARDLKGVTKACAEDIATHLDTSSVDIGLMGMGVHFHIGILCKKIEKETLPKKEIKACICKTAKSTSRDIFVDEIRSVVLMQKHIARPYRNVSLHSGRDDSDRF